MVTIQFVSSAGVSYFGALYNLIFPLKNHFLRSLCNGWCFDGLMEMLVRMNKLLMVFLIANHIFRIFVFYCPLCWNFTIMMLAELMCKWLLMAWNGFCLFFIYFFFWNLCFGYHRMTAKWFWFWSFLQLVAFLSLLISTTGIIPVLIQIDTGLVHVV